ncbi:MAG: hypothetical protein KIT84_22210 [Labilithrix sp.]|nr:hypothetical protein [Labilithrix sp.]MCW5813760.1 hypothetical protein [Labilithrix sp.]
MARQKICLLPHCAYLSETTRMLAIRRALLARGADVCVATHGGTHEELLKAEGVRYTVVGTRLTNERCKELVRMGAGMGPPNQSMWTDAEIRAYAEAEARFFRENDVGVAVTGFTLTTLLSTRLAEIPLVTEHAGSFVPPVWERKMIEPFLTQMVPGIRFLPTFLLRAFNNVGMNKLKFYCAGFNRVAKELGVEDVPSFAALLLSDLTLVPDTPDVLGVPAEVMDRWRPAGAGYRASTRLRYAGPIFAQIDRPVPERVTRFLDGGGPVAYVAITSSLTEEVRGVVSALRSSGARLLVAGTVHDVGDLAGDDVLVEQVLPSHLVMPKVDLAVTAGGQGSVQCAMAAGTPLITIPLQPEQDFNGQLVERHGAGARIAMRDATSPAIADLAKRILGDARFRDGARRVRDSYAKVDGPLAAADAILELVAERRAA